MATGEPTVDSCHDSSLREGILLGIGNPLLDISAVVEPGLLLKYGMNSNDAILAEDKHKPLKDELIQKYNAEFLAGGSVQNTLRICQWIVKKPLVTTYFGCVGTDKYSKILEEKAREAGVNVKYQYVTNKPTGTCSVLIQETHRSLCADLGAAECFTLSHIQQPENLKLVNAAQYFYISGFFLTVSPETIMEIANHAHQHKKQFIMNLSAPFLSKLYKKPMMAAMPYVDVLFGNEEELASFFGDTSSEEAAAFSREQDLGTEDLREIALKICNLPKKNPNRSRVCVITQGHEPVLFAVDGTVSEVPIPVLSKDKIVDTNGAGDAFAGGFLSQYIQNQPLEICVRCATYAASEIIQHSGCSFSGESKFER